MSDNVTKKYKVLITTEVEMDKDRYKEHLQSKIDSRKRVVDSILKRVENYNKSQMSKVEEYSSQIENYQNEMEKLK